MGYFKPWRRKIGVLMLAITCVVMGIWLRKPIGYQEYIFQEANDPPDVLKFKTHRFIIASTSRKFILSHVRNDSRLDMVGPFYEDTANPFHPVGVINVGMIHATEVPIVREWKCFGIELAQRGQMKLVDVQPIEVTSFAIAYLTIVIPLTLISAWLLLRKIRNPKPQAEPAPSKA